MRRAESHRRDSQKEKDWMYEKRCEGMKVTGEIGKEEMTCKPLQI